MKSKDKINYGIDAPRMGLTIVFLFGLLILASVVLRLFETPVLKKISDIGFSLVPTGVIVIILIILYIKVEKFRHRDRMLNMLSWDGDERVLDIGTGKGLLMIGAAKRLTTGASYGIDIWNQADLSNNSYESVLQNADLEGVKDKIFVQYANAIAIPFPENSFDYVLSNLCIHNIENENDRKKACREIARVLKPGGSALISDIMFTLAYQKEFQSLGMVADRKFSFLFAPLLLWIVKVRKPL